MPNLDRRTNRGKELAAQMNRQTILDNMPKVYFVADPAFNRFRVGRTDWPGDAFNLVPEAEFAIFRKVYEGLSMPLIDETNN